MKGRQFQRDAMANHPENTYQSKGKTIRWPALISPLILLIIAGVDAVLWVTPAWALPPEDEVPEEILRTEIITEARSPIDGQPLTPAEYAALQEALQAPPENPTVDPDIRRLIFLLQLRRGVRTLIPFIP